MPGFGAVGSHAVGAIPGSGQTFTLVAATGFYTLTGFAALFSVTMPATQGSYSVTGFPAIAQLSLLAAPGFYNLSGFPASAQFSPVQKPMAAIRDYWDVDEWGKFLPGGGVRYTI